MSEDGRSDDKVEGVAFNMGAARMYSINTLIDAYTMALMSRNLFMMYKILESIYKVTSFEFNEKERIAMKLYFNSINPYSPKSYILLNDYAEKLFDLLHKYKFLIPKGEGGKPAIFKR